MKKISQLKLNTKLLLYIISAIVVIYSAIFTFIGVRMGPVLQEGIESVADNNVARHANLFRSYLAEDMQVSRTLADAFETYLPLTPKERVERSIALLQKSFYKHQYFRAIYTSWERRYVDPNWTKPYGRIRISLGSPPKSETDNSNLRFDTLNSFGDDLNGLYYKNKIEHNDLLTEPYEDVYDGKKQTVATFSNPIVSNGQFLGAMGMDIPLKRFAEIINTSKKYYNSSVFLLSNKGVFVGSHREELVGKNINDIIKVDNIDLDKNISEGKIFSLYVDQPDDEYYVTFYPFSVMEGQDPWMVGVALPKSEMIKIMKRNFIALFGVSLLGLLILFFVIYFLSKGITGPITNITNMLRLLARGDIYKVEEININREDEIGEIIDSTNILVENLRKTAGFAKEIGEGQLEGDYEVISSDDVLGNSLINMRKSLLKANTEEENRRKEEEKQNWATIGYAKFGELLRNNTDNMETFTYNVISNLVKYTNSNQGALFLLNVDDDQDQYLTMSSCYAYDRKKYVDKRIELGSNLVGQCFLEGETIYMTDIPENYISITSGLGDANPNTLVIVPLKFNEKVFGVMELASFHNYEAYQIAFIEKLGESIASTISTVRINLQTVQLLEESKLKSEELAAQEEEMRQNMEELQTTQEESARRELDMNGVLAALNSSYIVLELDLDAVIININENAKNMMGFSNNDNLEGKNLRSLLKQDELEGFEDLWQTVINGESVSKQHTINRSGRNFIISESYTPIYNDMDEVYKILNIGVEIEES